MVTAEDVNKVLASDEYDDSVWEFLENLYPHSKAHEIEGLGKVQVVEDHGGHEGAGEIAYVVIRVNDEQYFKIDGHYMSFDGTTWDDEFYEVVPKQKVITVYEKP